MAGVPEWVFTIASRLAAMLFLDAWQIDIYPDNASQRPAGNESADGLASLQSHYKRARLFFDRDIQPDKDGFELVAHEVLHIALSEMSDTVAHIVEFAPEGHRDTLTDLYERAEERLVSTLARGMTKTFDFQHWLDEETDDTEAATG
jgi:hypothetical protein